MGSRSIPRRRSRLGSTTYQAERRWRPTPLMVVLVVGLVLGLAVGMQRRSAGNTGELEDQYMVLTSQLYSQGVPVAQISDRLQALGYSTPAAAVAQSAARM